MENGQETQDEDGKADKQEKIQRTNIIDDFLTIIEQPKSCKKKYKTLDNEKRKNLYLGILKEIVKTIQMSEIESLKKLSKLINHITNAEKEKPLLATFYDDDENPLKSTNLIIVTCKYNQIDALKYFSDKEIKVLGNLSTDIGRKKIEMVDKDEEGHTSCYYAIRSRNIDLLQLLIKPDNFHPAKLSAELTDLLMKDYECLKLRNVEISEMMQFFVENWLTRKCFFQRIGNENLTRYSEKSALKIDNVHERMEMLFTAVDEFKKILSDTTDSDLSKSSYLALFIARNIRILKGQLKETYKLLPWEEIEFCLSRFSSLSTLERKNLEGHLMNFIDEVKTIFGHNVEDVKRKIKKYINSDLPADRHNWEVRKKESLKFLYDDYEAMRDEYSLKKIIRYIEYALQVPVEELDKPSGRVIIERALQVIGENVKNENETPNLSDNVRTIFIAEPMFPLLEIAPSLRNMLSHCSDPNRLLAKNRIGIKKGFFRSIQDDLRKIQRVVTQIFRAITMNQIEKRCVEIINNDDPAKAKELIDKLVKKIELEKNEFIDSPDRETCVLDYIEEQVEEMRKIIDRYTEQEKKMLSLQPSENFEQDERLKVAFTEIVEIIQRGRVIITEERIHFRSSIEGASKVLKICKTNKCPYSNRYLDETKKQSRIIFNTTRNTRVGKQPFIREDFLKVLEKILENCEGRNFQKMFNVFYKIRKAAESESVKTNMINEFKEKMHSLDIKDKSHERQVETELDDVWKMFKNQVKNNELYEKLETALEEKKKIHKNVLKLSDHFEGKIDLVRTEFEFLVKELIDETEDRKTKLRNYFAFKENISKMVKKSNDPYGDFLEQKKSLEQLIRSLIGLKPTKTCTQLCQTIESVWCKKNVLFTDRKLQLDDTINTVKVELTEDCQNKNLTDLIEKLEIAKRCHKAKRNLLLYFEKTIKLTAKEYQDYVANLMTAPKTKEKLSKSYNFSNKTILAESLNDSYGAFIKSSMKTKTKLKDIFNAFQVFSKSLKLETDSEKKLENIYYQLKMNIIEGYFSEKLSLLKETLKTLQMPTHESTLRNNNNNNNNNDDDDNNNNNNNNINEARQAGMEMILLDLSEISSNVDQLPLGCSEKSYSFLKGSFPSLMEVSLRHYLAHGDPLIDALSYNHVVFSNALVFAEEGDSIMALKNILTDEKMRDYLLSRLNNEKLHELNKEKLPAELEQHGESVKMLQQSSYWLDYLKNMISNKGKFNMTMRIQSDFIGSFNNHLKLLDDLRKLFVAATMDDDALEIENLLKQGQDIYSRDKDNRTLLHIAAKNGRKKIVEFLLKNSVQVDAIDKHGDTSLHSAVSEGHYHVVKLLLKKGSKIDTKNHRKFTMLHHAALTGKLRLIRLAMKKDASNVNDIDNDGNQPLHLASSSKYDNPRVIEYLLEKGAHVNSRDNEEDTPLFLAAYRGNAKIVQVLLRWKAQIMPYDDHSITAFHAAAFGGNLEIFKMLANHERVDAPNNFMIDGKVEKRSTPLDIAAHFGHSAIVEYLCSEGAMNDTRIKNGITSSLRVAIKNLDIVKSLTRRDESLINKPDSVHKRTPLHWAVMVNAFDVVEYLVENGGDFLKIDQLGFQPLHYWGFDDNCDENIVNYLTERGASLTTPDSPGTTLLHHVAAIRNLRAVKYIVEKYPQLIDTYDRSDASPLSHALFSVVLNDAFLSGTINFNADLAGVVSFLVEKNPGAINKANNYDGCTPLLYAIRSGDNNIVKFLLENGASIEVTDNEGENPLHAALHSGYKDIAKTLLREKSVENIINDSSHDGYTPLHRAACCGYADIAKALLEKGAQTDLPNKNRRTPIHVAAMLGHASFIEILLNNKANVDALDSLNVPPISMSVVNRDANCLDIFLYHGAKLDDDDVTAKPLTCAIEFGFEDIVEILLNGGADANSREPFYGVTHLMHASFTGYHEIVELLLIRDVDVRAKDESDKTSLMYAVMGGDAKTVDILLEKCVDNINDKITLKRNDPTRHRYTAICFAAEYGHAEIAKLLLNKGAEILVHGEFGTPLHISALRGDGEFVNILLDHRSDIINIRERQCGCTPLHWATISGHANVVEILLRRGADRKAITKSGITALTIAESENYEEIVAMLLDHQNEN